MKILTVQDAFNRRFTRQKSIPDLEYHAYGYCAHIGKISLGCYGCFVPQLFRANISVGEKCNVNCPYCTEEKDLPEPGSDNIGRNKKKIYIQAFSQNICIPSISFSGGGEPLIYLEIINDYMKFFRDIERDTKNKPWYYLYTNGLLADKDTLKKLKGLGFDEIRFHLGATNFSRKVYQNMKNAVKYINNVTVETPAWPPHRKKLFEMLPIIEDIGVKHLNIGEIEIRHNNYFKLLQNLPDAEIYHGFIMHVYGGDLVYDIIEEVVKRKYSYSVLDCSGLVKSLQRSPAKVVYRQDKDFEYDKYFEI